MEGFYYNNGSVAMILDDMDRVRSKMPLPPESYVPLVGGVSGNVQNGDKISVAGTLFKPGSGDEESIRGEPAAVRIGAASGVKLVNSAKRLQVEVLDPSIDLPQPTAQATKYALLIGGGYNSASEGIWFRNGILAAKQLLLMKGWPADHIRVLYGSGVVPGGGLAPVSPATKVNICNAFGWLASQVKNTDTLYIMVSTYGGGLLTQAVGSYPPGMYWGAIDTNGDEAEAHSEAALHADINHDGDMHDVLKVDETIWVWPNPQGTGQVMTDDEMRIQVNRVQHYAKMIIQMDSSFCGGFIRDLTGPRRMIITSVGPDKLSWNEPSNQWDAFTPWWLGAFIGHRPWSSYLVPADANGNGHISVVEAYNKARVMGFQPGAAGYEDNGVYPGWCGQMPYGGDGALGLATNL
jgi:hypothetical protein